MMGRRLFLVASVAAFAVCLAAPGASAQVRDTTAAARDSARRDSLERPFVRGGVYDKPYQTRLLGRTAIGGYAEAHARLEHVDGLRDEATFEAKRFNLFTATRVSDWVRIGAEIEFEEGAREIKLEYAAIDLRLHPSVTIRGGMLLSPLGRFNLAHDSPQNEHTDRPLVSTELIGVALSEPGFGVLGQFALGGRARMTYEAYATNGFHDGLITSSPEGTRIALGRDNFADNNGSPAVVARLAFSPRVGYELGASAHHGAYNVFNLEGTEIDKRRDLSILVLDAEATVFGVRLAAEGALARIEVPVSLEGIYAARQRGFYLDAAYDFGRALVRTMPRSYFTVKTRLDLVDFDADLTGQTRAQITVGLNFRPTTDSVLKLDLVRGRGRDRFNNLTEHAFLLTSIATYF